MNIQSVKEKHPTDNSVSYCIEKRKKVVYNNDPQRRCYNGVHFSTDSYMTKWEKFESSFGDKGWTKEEAEERLAFWVDLNDYAISCRGQGAKTEYRIVGKDH